MPADQKRLSKNQKISLLSIFLPVRWTSSPLRRHKPLPENTAQQRPTREAAEAALRNSHRTGSTYRPLHLCAMVIRHGLTMTHSTAQPTSPDCAVKVRPSQQRVTLLACTCQCMQNRCLYMCDYFFGSDRVVCGEAEVEGEAEEEEGDPPDA
jgi:hypothetical protein